MSAQSRRLWKWPWTSITLEWFCFHVNGIVQLKKVFRCKYFMANITFEGLIVNHFVPLIFFIFGKPFWTLATSNYSNSTFLMCNKMTILPEKSLKRFFANIAFKWFRLWSFCLSYFIFIFGMNCLLMTLQGTWWGVIIIAFRTFVAGIFWNIWLVVVSRNIEGTSIVLFFVFLIIVFLIFRLAFCLYLKLIICIDMLYIVLHKNYFLWAFSIFIDIVFIISITEIAVRTVVLEVLTNICWFLLDVKFRFLKMEWFKMVMPALPRRMFFKLYIILCSGTWFMHNSNGSSRCFCGRRTDRKLLILALSIVARYQYPTYETFQFEDKSYDMHNYFVSYGYKYKLAT